MPLDKALTGVASNGIGLAIGVLIQVASVPVYLKGFGKATYGEWIVLSAIPTYLALSDLGFASVSSTRATGEFATGNGRAARCTLRSAWLLTTLVSLAMLTVACLALPLISTDTLPIEVGIAYSAHWVLILLTCYALGCVQSSFLEGCFRAGGRFPLGITIANLLRLAEFSLAAMIALWTHSPVAVAGALLGGRVAGLIVYNAILKRSVPELTLGFRGANLAEARRLAVPGLAFLSFPVGNMLAVQGMIMITAAELGATEVVNLNAARVLTNFVRQIANAVNCGVLPEVTVALARGQVHRARRLMNRSLAAALCLGALCSITLTAAGGSVLGLWTAGLVHASPMLLLMMSATVLADVPWLSWSLIAIARNDHRLLGVLYAGSCVLALAVAKLLLPTFGLLAIPVALLLIDVVLYVPTYRRASEAFVSSTPVE